MIYTGVLMLIPLALSLTAEPSLIDSDADGLSDRLEQELLVKFAPKLMISSDECDGLPARFHPGSPEAAIAKRRTEPFMDRSFQPLHAPDRGISSRFTTTICGIGIADVSDTRLMLSMYPLCYGLQPPNETGRFLESRILVRRRA